jgi:hypothetical protein
MNLVRHWYADYSSARGGYIHGHGLMLSLLELLDPESGNSAWQLFLLNEGNSLMDVKIVRVVQAGYKRFYSPSTAP